MRLVSELRRRNVFRMAVLYVVAAWAVMQAAEVLIGLANLPDWVGPTLLIVLAVGFPIALTFSWVFEITPEGLALEKDVPEGASITHITGRRMDFIVIAVLSAGLILFAYDKWWIGPPPDRSIAVLAFENMSGDPDQEYFSDGIAEELLNLLSKVPELLVISRSSSFSFKGKDLDIREIAEQLNVANVLEGSVRKSGNRIRVTAQLIEARSDTHIWSETYDRELEDILEIQDDIAADIVDALKEHLAIEIEGELRVPTAANVEAHHAYLRGNYLLAQRTTTSIEGAVREFESAIRLDPDYAPAHAQMAVAIIFQSGMVFGAPTLSEAVARAAPHAERALALAPTLAEVHAANGFLFHPQGDPKLALRHFKRAVQINPNYSIVHAWMALDYFWLGRYEESFVAVETAARTDPLSRVAVGNYVGSLIERDRLAEAQRELEKLASIAPDRAASMRGVLESLGGKWANRLLGGLEASRSDMSRPTRRDLSSLFALIGLEKEALTIFSPPGAWTLIRLGRPPEDAVAIAEHRLAVDPINKRYRHTELAVMLAAAGDYDRARPLLEEQWQEEGGLVTVNLGFSVHAATALIDISRHAGDEARVSELISAIRDNVRRYREAGMTRAFINRSADFEEGIAYYLAGEREKGLGLIAKGAEDGYFIETNLAYLQALYDDPDFAPIRAGQEARQARERHRFLSIVCSANPYASFWQPAEGTCESFAAENDASR